MNKKARILNPEDNSRDCEPGGAMLDAEACEIVRVETETDYLRWVVHKFSNLLMVINGYSGLLLEKLDAGGPFHEQVTEIRNAGRRAAEINSQLQRKTITQAKAIL